jgi:hypothetical protein
MNYESRRDAAFVDERRIVAGDEDGREALIQSRRAVLR